MTVKELIKLVKAFNDSAVTEVSSKEGKKEDKK